MTAEQAALVARVRKWSGEWVKDHADPVYLGWADGKDVTVDDIRAVLDLADGSAAP